MAASERHDSQPESVAQRVNSTRHKKNTKITPKIEIHAPNHEHTTHAQHKTETHIRENLHSPHTLSARLLGICTANNLFTTTRTTRKTTLNTASCNTKPYATQYITKIIACTLHVCRLQIFSSSIVVSVSANVSWFLGCAVGWSFFLLFWKLCNINKIECKIYFRKVMLASAKKTLLLICFSIVANWW